MAKECPINVLRIEAVPIVRCKDCEFSEVDQNYTVGIYCNEHERYARLNDFCSWAMEKEEK